MSSETPAPPAENVPTATEPTTQAPAQETDWKAKYEETLAHSRKWEDRAKENKGAAEKLAEIERANETEVERIKREADEAKAERDALKAEKQVTTWKDEVAKASGVPAAALSGSTLEEIQAHAEVLKPLITPTETPSRKGAIGPYVPNEGKTPAVPLNSDALEDALRDALGIS